MPEKKTRKPRNRKPAMEIIAPAMNEADDALFPSGESNVTTREDVAQLVDSAYAGLNEEQLRTLREDMYSRFEFDTPYSRGYQVEKLGVPGKFTLLREWTWVERMDVLERSHQAWERNPLAKAGVGWTTRFAIGNGGTLTYKAEAVKEVIEEFINDPLNSFQSYEREVCEALQVDGEIFFRYFENAQGRVALAPMRPWHVQWLTTDPENFKDVLSYHYVYIIYGDQPGASTLGIVDVPADEVLHVAINRLHYELRGRPELFSILPWLKAYRDWLEERARLQRRMSVYYHVSLDNATPGMVATYQQKFSKPPAPGSIIVTNKNVTWEVLNSAIRATDASEDGRQIKLMALAGMQLPEYMMSDGANANLASATAQQLPALRKFADFQDILTDQVWKPIFKHVIACAVKAGRIKGEVIENGDGNDVMLPMVDSNGDPVYEDASTQPAPQTTPSKPSPAVPMPKAGKPKMVKASEAFDYAYPQLEEKDPYNLAKALQIALGLGLVSEETAASDMGFDYVAEQKKMEAETAKRLEKAMQTPAGFNPDGTPIAPKDMAVLTKAGEPNVKQNGQGGGSIQTGPTNMPDRTLPPSDASPAYSGQQN